MELAYKDGKTYPYQVVRDDSNGSERVIGIGKTKEEAWESAAMYLDSRLFRIIDMMKELTNQ